MSEQDPTSCSSFFWPGIKNCPSGPCAYCTIVGVAEGVVVFTLVMVRVCRPWAVPSAAIWIVCAGTTVKPKHNHFTKSHHHRHTLCVLSHREESTVILIFLGTTWHWIQAFFLFLPLIKFRHIPPNTCDSLLCFLRLPQNVRWNIYLWLSGTEWSLPYSGSWPGHFHYLYHYWILLLLWSLSVLGLLPITRSKFFCKYYSRFSPYRASFTCQIWGLTAK